MLKLATQEPFWGGACVELNMSYDNLRDHQWKRLLEAVYAYPGWDGPYEARYTPQQPTPAKAAISIPEPTAALTQFAAWEIAPGVSVGVELFVTRSLFECVTVSIPLRMFDGATPALEDPTRQALEKKLYEMAVHLFDVVTFDIAALGIDRGCQLITEMVTDDAARTSFLQTGNFLIREDSLIALRLNPRMYESVGKYLVWCAAKR